MQPGLQADNLWPLPAPRDAAAAQADWWLDSSPMEELRAALRCRPLPPCSLHDTGACTCQQSGAGGGLPAPAAWDALDLYGSAASSWCASSGCGGGRSPGGALVAAEVVGGAALGEARLRASYTRALRQLHSRWQRSRQQLEQRHQQVRGNVLAWSDAKQGCPGCLQVHFSILDRREGVCGCGTDCCVGKACAPATCPTSQVLRSGHKSSTLCMLLCVQELQQQAAAHASALQQLLASQQALLGQLGAGGELGGRLAALAAQQEALADQVQQLAAQVSALTLPALLPCLGSSCVECGRHDMPMCAVCLVTLKGRA